MEIFSITRGLLSGDLLDLLPETDIQAKGKLLQEALCQIYPNVEISDVTASIPSDVILAGNEKDLSASRLEVRGQWEDMANVYFTLFKWLEEGKRHPDKQLSLHSIEPQDVLQHILIHSAGYTKENTVDQGVQVNSDELKTNLSGVLDKGFTSVITRETERDLVIDLENEDNEYVSMPSTPVKRSRGRPPGAVKRTSASTPDDHSIVKKLKTSLCQKDVFAKTPIVLLPRISTRAQAVASEHKTKSTSSRRIVKTPKRYLLAEVETPKSKSKLETPKARTRGRPRIITPPFLRRRSDTRRDHKPLPDKSKICEKVDSNIQVIKTEESDESDHGTEEQGSGSPIQEQDAIETHLPDVSSGVADTDNDLMTEDMEDSSNMLDESIKQESGKDNDDIVFNPETADATPQKIPVDLEQLVSLDGSEYQCQKCPYKTFTFRYIKVHIQRAHSTRDFTCEECGKKFGLNKDLVAHKLIHDKKHPCTTCGKAFAKPYLLQQHRLNRHQLCKKQGRPPGARSKMEPQVYACDQCDFKSMKYKNYMTHYQRKHGDKKYECSSCDKKFGLQKDLQQHIKCHFENFVCELCQKPLKSKYALDLHTKRIHLKVALKPQKSYQCDECGKVCRSKTDYKVHQNKEHLNLRPFACMECGMSFYAKANLKVHMQVHKDTFDFVCPVCGKCFRQRPGLRVHMFSHMEAETRPFKCSVCHKLFTQKGALNRHERIHTGERPYICKLCSAAFNDYSILRRHVLGIHKLDDQDLVRKTVQEAIEIAKKIEASRMEQPEDGGRSSPPMSLPDPKAIEDQQRVRAREYRYKYLQRKKAEGHPVILPPTVQVLMNKSSKKDTIKIEPVTRDDANYGYAVGENMKIELQITNSKCETQPGATVVTLVPKELGLDQVDQSQQKLDAEVIDKKEVSEMTTLTVPASDVSTSLTVGMESEHVTFHQATISETPVLATVGLSQPVELVQDVQSDIVQDYSMSYGQPVLYPDMDGQMEGVYTTTSVVGHGEQEMEHIIVITNMSEDQQPDLNSILSSYHQQQGGEAVLTQVPAIAPSTLPPSTLEGISDQQQIVSMSYEQAARLLGSQAASVLGGLVPQGDGDHVTPFTTG